eukprot:g1295.t1
MFDCVHRQSMARVRVDLNDRVRSALASESKEESERAVAKLVYPSVTKMYEDPFSSEADMDAALSPRLARLFRSHGAVYRALDATPRFDAPRRVRVERIVNVLSNPFLEDALFGDTDDDRGGESAGLQKRRPGAVFSSFVVAPEGGSFGLRHGPTMTPRHFECTFLESFDRGSKRRSQEVDLAHELLVCGMNEFVRTLLPMIGHPAYAMLAATSALRSSMSSIQSEADELRNPEDRAHMEHLVEMSCLPIPYESLGPSMTSYDEEEAPPPMTIEPLWRRMIRAHHAAGTDEEEEASGAASQMRMIHEILVMTTRRRREERARTFVTNAPSIEEDISRDKSESILFEWLRYHFKNRLLRQHTCLPLSLQPQIWTLYGEPTKEGEFEYKVADIIEAGGGGGRDSGWAPAMR